MSDRQRQTQVSTRKLILVVMVLLATKGGESLVARSSPPRALLGLGFFLLSGRSASILTRFLFLEINIILLLEFMPTKFDTVNSVVSQAFILSTTSFHQTFQHIANMSGSGSNAKVDLDENKGPNILAPMWALTILTTFFVSARIFIRARVVKKVGFDDWIIMVSMVCYQSILATCH